MKALYQEVIEPEYAFWPLTRTSTISTWDRLLSNLRWLQWQICLIQGTCQIQMTCSLSWMTLMISSALSSTTCNSTSKIVQILPQRQVYCTLSTLHSILHNTLEEGSSSFKPHRAYSDSRISKSSLKLSKICTVNSHQARWRFRI